jgi:hypothetical protein
MKEGTPSPDPPGRRRNPEGGEPRGQKGPEEGHGPAPGTERPEEGHESAPGTERPAPAERPPESTARWELAAVLFGAALDRPASERRAWLASLSDVNETLREEVASLIDACEKAGDFLDPEGIRFPTADLPDTEPDGGST